MRSEAEANRAVEKYADSVRRVCFLHLKNYCDVEDVFQEVFLKYILHDRPFESDAHEKAWLIRVSINNCKDLKKNFFRRNVFSMEDINAEPFYIQNESILFGENKEILEEVLKLHDKYRDVIHLFYYEGQ